MLPRCREVSKAVATGTGGDRPLLQRALLRLHLLLCEPCRRHARAIAALGGQLRRSLADSPEAGRLEALERRIVERAADLLNRGG